MKKKHRLTLEAIYKVQANIDWHDIESLLVELGAELRERSGSRVRFRFEDGSRMVLHEPHPSNETSRGTVRGIKNFLKSRGTRP